MRKFYLYFHSEKNRIFQIFQKSKTIFFPLQNKKVRCPFILTPKKIKAPCELKFLKKNLLILEQIQIEIRENITNDIKNFFGNE